MEKVSGTRKRGQTQFLSSGGGEGVCFFWWGGRAWQQGRWGLLRFNVRPYGPGTKEAASIISIVRYRAVRRSGDKRTRKRRGPTNVGF